ncbi:MAG: hypothetical protein HZA90_13225 [Verrucomicrobia bacterium]|nr:hypothetical protein [Verrucomicrobiota bacterium]
MSVKLESKSAKAPPLASVPRASGLDKEIFRAAKKRVFAKHAALLRKLAK